MLIVALIGTPRGQKLRAFGIILGWMAGGFGVGTGIGYAFGSAAAAGSLAGLLMMITGIFAANDRRRMNNKLLKIPPHIIQEEKEKSIPPSS
jgi:hypothetical protein